MFSVLFPVRHLTAPYVCCRFDYSPYSAAAAAAGRSLGRRSSRRPSRPGRPLPPGCRPTRAGSLSFCKSPGCAVRSCGSWLIREARTSSTACAGPARTAFGWAARRRPPTRPPHEPQRRERIWLRPGRDQRRQPEPGDELPDLAVQPHAGGDGAAQELVRAGLSGRAVARTLRVRE